MSCWNEEFKDLYFLRRDTRRRLDVVLEVLVNGLWTVKGVYNS
jgi:hypothetical protein